MFQLLKWQTGFFRYSWIRQQQKNIRNVLNLQELSFILEEEAAETKMDENGKITTVILDNGEELKSDLIIVAARSEKCNSRF